MTISILCGYSIKFYLKILYDGDNIARSNDLGKLARSNTHGLEIARSNDREKK